MHQMHMQTHPHLRNLSQSPPRLMSIHSTSNSSLQSPPLQMQSQPSPALSQSIEMPPQQIVQPLHTLTQMQHHHNMHHHQQQQSPHMMHNKIQKGPPSSMSATPSHHTMANHINQNGGIGGVGGGYHGHNQTQNGETRPSVIESNQPIIIGCT